ncbi:hypothetical protein V6N11_052910 [Hibiscus sabdariffa]|uniref:Uncharacterized protein n=2 Tax=Hibiscus sabdariffa TaxID=183260 RepID=A0ABR1Z6M8_9ROSI
MELQGKKVQSGCFTNIEDQFNDGKYEGLICNFDFKVVHCLLVNPLNCLCLYTLHCGFESISRMVDVDDLYRFMLLLMEKRLLIRDKISMGKGEMKPNRTIERLIRLMQNFKRTEDFIVDTLKLRIYISSYLCETFKVPSMKIIMCGADWDKIWHDLVMHECNLLDKGHSHLFQYWIKSYVNDVAVTRKRCWQFDMDDFRISNESTRFCASGCNVIADSRTSMLAGLTGIIVQINHAIGESGVVSQEYKDVVSKYGDKIIDMLLANEQPKRICSQIGLCIFDGTQGVSMRIESVVNQNIGKASGTLHDFMCSACEMTIVWMQNQLEKN